MRTALMLAAMAVCAAPVVAQGPTPEELAEYERTLAELERSFTYQQGEVTLGEGLATLRVPERFRFLGPQDAQRLIEDGWGNPPGDAPLGMLVPAGVSPFDEAGWGVIITFEEDGYVEDDDAASLDFDDLLSEMQDGVREENEARAEAGYEAIALIGWAEPPHYDPATHKLYWAKELEFGGDPAHTLNYNVRVLGRRGVLVLNAVASMDQLATVQADMTDALAVVDFNEGHRYTDYQPGTDKIAAYGIGALIAGNVAAKAGLFKVLLGGLVAMKKFLVVGVVAVVAGLRRVLGRRRVVER